MRRVLAGIALIAATPAAAQDAPCPLPLTAPAPWRGWDRPAPLMAAERADAKPQPMLAMSQAASVTLAPARTVAFVAPPAKIGGPASYGGMVFVAVPAAGTYRFALGRPAWIEVAQGTRTIASIAHQHGPACSGITKLVDFALTPGTYAVEIAAAPAPVTMVMVTRLP